jgi:hypothetical protein
VDLMGEPPNLSDFLPGRSFGPTPQLCAFIEAIGQSTAVKHDSLINLDVGPASESFESLLTRTKSLRHFQVDLSRRRPLEESATAAIASGFSQNTTLRKIELIDRQETNHLASAS